METKKINNVNNESLNSNTHKNTLNKNTVFVGAKDFSKYLNAIYRISNEDNEEIIICARGKYISRAVDLAVSRHFVNTLKIKNTEITREVFTGDDNREKYVSSIKITLEKI